MITVLCGGVGAARFLRALRGATVDGVATPIASRARQSAGRSRLATLGKQRFCSWPTRISPNA